jgi:hypothetical protein
MTTLVPHFLALLVLTPPPLIDLSKDARELKNEFNANPDYVRLIMILSPG